MKGRFWKILAFSAALHQFINRILCRHLDIRKRTVEIQE